MSPTEINVAIAESLGWKVESGPVRNGWCLRDGKGCVVSSWWLTDEEARRSNRPRWN